MFERVLVANRGEIACRVIETLREHGIGSVAVYSDDDAEALHVRLADDARRIGEGEPDRSYLNIEAILRAACEAGAQAVHPGYGFLSESPEFAAAVEEAGLVFVGPTPEQARLFGDKRASREAARRARVPVVPGSEGGATGDGSPLAEAAERIGYPVIVKAALGGGGKGMQRVARREELAAAVESASRLGASAFGDAAVYLEKALEAPRHVEVQILGDGRGRVIHLLERECSLQRRHQKVIEETPSPGIDEPTRRDLLAAAVRLGESVRYRGAGTVEFLVTPERDFFFLEMNTRLQVEHPVTEWVTGLDLVWLQLVVAARGELPLAQAEVTGRGHAVEARIYAEDPLEEFLPQAGRLTRVAWPARPFVRVDAGVETGSEVSVRYDPILAKVSCWARDRADLFERLSAALAETVIHGLTTNLDLLRDLSRDEGVRRGRFDTSYLEESFHSPFVERVREADPLPALAAATLAFAEEGPPGPASPAPPRGAEWEPFRRLGRWRQPGLDRP